MLELLIVIGRALALGLRGHRELVLENVALRQQLTTMKRATKRPRLQARDRATPPIRPCGGIAVGSKVGRPVMPGT